MKCSIVECAAEATERIVYSYKGTTVYRCDEHKELAQALADELAHKAHKKRGSVWWIAIPEHEGEAP